MKEHRRSLSRHPVFRILVIWVIQALALVILTFLISGLRVDSLAVAFVAAAVIGLMNALLWPLLSYVLLPFAVLTLGVYRYQQIAYLARAGARYASTHGAQYRADHRLSVGDAVVWEQDIYEKGILPRISSLNPAQLTLNTDWSQGNNEANAADSSTRFQSTIPNSVSVTVAYEWFPEAFLGSPLTFTSSSTMPMTY